MKRTQIVLNPIASRGSGARVEPELRSLLKATGIDFDLLRTARLVHAMRLAEQFQAKQPDALTTCSPAPHTMFPSA